MNTLIAEAVEIRDALERQLRAIREDARPVSIKSLRETNPPAAKEDGRS